MNKHVCLAVSLLFLLSTFSLGIDDGDPCNDCDRNPLHDGVPGDGAGADGCCGSPRSEAPDAPVHPHGDFHCCCNHGPVFFALGDLQIAPPVLSDRISLSVPVTHFAPDFHAPFHVPIT